MPPQPSSVIVVGASAGGVEALREFVSGLPADLPSAVLVVLHLPPGGVSALPAILSRAGDLPVMPAEHGAPLRPGVIYTAVPDHHLLVTSSHLALSRGPTENGHRPSVDALFRSAAVSWAPHVAGVVLSGALDDGTAGLAAIKSRSGLAVVQRPQDALYRGMPDSALAHVAVDHVLPAGEIGVVMTKQLPTRQDLPAPPPLSEMDELEALIDAGSAAETGNEGIATVAQPSELSCPDCNGVLYTVEPGRRYRCRVGHGWTAEALMQAQEVEVERALWTALRALEERRSLAGRMRSDALRVGQEWLAERYSERDTELADAAAVLRRLLLDDPPG